MVLHRDIVQLSHNYGALCKIACLRVHSMYIVHVMYAVCMVYGVYVLVCRDVCLFI